jgi:hypothetical protein
MLIYPLQSRKEGSRFRTLMAAQLLMEKGSLTDKAPVEDEVAGVEEEGQGLPAAEISRR